MAYTQHGTWMTLGIALLSACGGVERDAPAAARDADRAASSPSATSTVSSIEPAPVVAFAVTPAAVGLDGAASLLVARNAGNDVSVAVVNITTRYCDAPDPAVDAGNGSVVTTLDDVAPLGPSVGDITTEVFDQCRVGNAVVSGNTRYLLTNITGAPFTLGVWSFTIARRADLTTRIGAAVSVHQGTQTAVTEMNAAGEFITTTDGSSTHNTGTGGAPFTMSRQFHARTATNNATGVTTREFDLTHNNDFAGNVTSITTQPLISVRRRGAPVPLPGGVTINSLANYTAGAIRVVETMPAGGRVVSLATVQPDGSVRVERDLNADGVNDQILPAIPWAQLSDLHLRIETSP